MIGKTQKCIQEEWIMNNRKNDPIYKLVLTALMAALCYVAFTFLKIPVPTFGGDYVALHIGNAFCVLVPQIFS